MPCHLPIDVCNSQRSFYLRFSSRPRRAASLNNAARNGKVEKGGDFKHVEYFPFHFFGLSSFPLFIDELHHFSRWLLHHQPVTTSYFQFLLSPPRTQFWNLLSSHSMSAFSLVHGQCLAVQLTILPEQSCLGCWYALDMCLVGGLEHGFYSPIIYGIILPPLTNSYFSEG